METKNIMIVGVGGQGTLLASKLLGRLLLTKGYDVKVSEVHGMSQRGGSVVTYVRWGDKVYSPIIDKAGGRPLDRIPETRRKDHHQHPTGKPHARHHRCGILSPGSGREDD